MCSFLKTWGRIECSATYRRVGTLCAAIIIGYIGHQLVSDSLPPVFIKKTEAINSPIKAGSSLVVRIHRDKRSDRCTLTSQRSAVSKSGIVYDLPDVLNVPGGNANETYVDVPYDTRKLPTGTYDLVVMLEYKCGWLGLFNFPTAQPLTRFKVVDRAVD